MGQLWQIQNFCEQLLLGVALVQIAGHTAHAAEDAKYPVGDRVLVGQSRVGTIVLDPGLEVVMTVLALVQYAVKVRFSCHGC